MQLSSRQSAAGGEKGPTGKGGGEWGLGKGVPAIGNDGKVHQQQKRQSREKKKVSAVTRDSASSLPHLDRFPLWSETDDWLQINLHIFPPTGCFLHTLHYCIEAGPSARTHTHKHTEKLAGLSLHHYVTVSYVPAPLFIVGQKKGNWASLRSTPSKRAKMTQSAAKSQRQVTPVRLEGAKPELDVVWLCRLLTANPQTT